MLFLTREACETHQLDRRCRPDLMSQRLPDAQVPAPASLSPVLPDAPNGTVPVADARSPEAPVGLFPPRPLPQVESPPQEPAAAEPTPVLPAIQPHEPPKLPSPTPAPAPAPVPTPPLAPAPAAAPAPAPHASDHPHVPAPTHAHAAPEPVFAPAPTHENLGHRASMNGSPAPNLPRYWAPHASPALTCRLEKALNGKVHATGAPPSGGGKLHIIVAEKDACCCNFLDAMTKVDEEFQLYEWDDTRDTFVEIKKPIPPEIFIKVPVSWCNGTPLQCEGMVFVPPPGSAGAVISVLTQQPRAVIDTSVAERVADIEDQIKERTGRQVDCGKVVGDVEWHLHNVAYESTGNTKALGYGFTGEQCTRNAISSLMGAEDARHEKDREQTLDAFAS
eukprot:TRINITY_DN15604_c0_g1_i1.p2 TRINITY_DN15604_c0_g1~~TRINITY_DN15604_c0_g1_i1.p2  ORF type:complete len:424 (+),score=67.74 TRINITY_DN15604_c0_g1_i1:102-1274(+)